VCTTIFIACTHTSCKGGRKKYIFTKNYMKVNSCCKNITPHTIKTEKDGQLAKNWVGEEAAAPLPASAVNGA